MTAVSKVGLVGLGFISPYHAAGVRDCAPDAEIIGVDINPQARRQSELRGIVDRTLASVDELIGAAPQVVHVLTPPNLHATVAVPLLSAGIEVFLEKPLAHQPETGDQIAEAASRSGARVGVGHNQLFYSTWERARAYIAQGRIGQVRNVDVVARKPLGFLRANDVGPWMMRASTNILFEVAPHAFAQVLDVVADVDVHSVRTGSVQQLPNGVDFYRQWDVLGSAGDVGVRISLSYEEAFAESSIAIRGTLGSLFVDFEHNTLTEQRRSFAAFDLEPFQQSAASAASVLTGATSSLAKVVAGKAGIKRFGDEYSGSIRRSIACFYEGRAQGRVDARQALPFSQRVVSLASRVADASCRRSQPAVSSRGAPATTSSPQPSREPQVLVVGGTGFIGAEFVRQLAALEPVRVLARNVAKAQRQFAGLDVDVAPGDVRDTDGIMRYVTPATAVFHLVFGRGSTWEELNDTDVRPAIALADACMAREVERFVYTSSIAIYDAGDPRATITETTSASKGVQRVAPYARSKIVVEEHLLRLYRERGFPVTIVRPGIVVGRSNNPVHWGVAAWPYPNVAVHWGSGRNPLPIVLVEDVAAAFVLLRSATSISGESFNLAAPGCITAEDYLEELARASGSVVRSDTCSAPRLYATSLLKWLVKVPSRSGAPFPSYADCRGRSFASRFDCSKACRTLGWSPVSDRAELLRRGVTEPAKEWSR
jgi:nucleoside-diphosphate-sugar epimerase/predicted dehydrogenase